METNLPKLGGRAVTFRSTSLNKKTDKKIVTFNQGMNLIKSKITKTTSMIDDTNGRYPDNSSVCCQWFSSFSNWSSYSAMKQFDAVVSTIMRGKLVDSDIFREAVTGLVKNSSAVCHQQCIILALYLRENGVPSERLKLVGFKNASATNTTYDPKHEGNVMLCVILERGKLYLDPFTGNTYSEYDIAQRINTKKPFKLHNLNSLYTYDDAQVKELDRRMSNLISYLDYAVPEKFVTNLLNS
ncbi:MAG: hypothetical protein ACK5Z5_02290 [Neisseriaceae bacterium]